ncbi:uncharacterized protein DFL_008106 [Arthrobotrys flagrans]|uniref:NADPH-dependent FMN reductase-like domain-containing protein n=1 Tax=Arthrobotrys flagrans TaxID=97331 RepID=A0A436ZMU4_ARTFL|nr:hypothetical protein DFL_008106 [Arthrobotrys flagrans]
MANFIIDTIKKNVPQDVSLKIVDLAERKLPTSEQSEIPLTIQSPELYSNELATRWSREISSHDGYIFLVPEYNGSYAGSLKSAFDYLYNEWSGKAAMIVSYGARPVEMLNGGKHFSDILSQLQMKLPSVLLKISVSTMDREKTASGESLVFYEKAVEDQVRSDISNAWEGVLKGLQVSNVSPASA